MQLYRVAPIDPIATEGEIASATFQTRQGTGRWDNPSVYYAWYFSTSPAAAVGEVFGDHSDWSTDLFSFPLLPTAVRSLVTVSVPDHLPILDLDDGATLVQMGTRPSRIVIRNLPYTQDLASRAYSEGRWAGMSWWSLQHPAWVNQMMWSTPLQPAEFVVQDVEPLRHGHTAVIDAAKTLRRLLPPL